MYGRKGSHHRSFGWRGETLAEEKERKEFQAKEVEKLGRGRGQKTKKEKKRGGEVEELEEVEEVEEE